MHSPTAVCPRCSRTATTQVRTGTDIEVSDVDRDGKPDIVAITAEGLAWFHNPDLAGPRSMFIILLSL